MIPFNSFQSTPFKTTFLPKSFSFLKRVCKFLFWNRYQLPYCVFFNIVYNILIEVLVLGKATINREPYLNHRRADVFQNTLQETWKVLSLGKCNGNSVHNVTTNWESVCSHMWSKIPFWLATNFHQLILLIFKMARYVWERWMHKVLLWMNESQ